MPRLPTDSIAAAQLLVRDLYRPIALYEGRQFFAVAETARPMGGDDWLWTDDNAKVLEFVSRPEVWRRFPQQPVEMLRFVEAMCRAPFIFRRVSAPRLERVAGGEGPSGNFLHSLMLIKSEMPRGAMIAGLRFHDGRDADNLVLSGNVVEFTYRRRRIRLNVGEAVSEASAELRGDTLTLRHSGELFFKAGWRERRLGRITYTYTINARSLLIGVEAVLDVDSTVAVHDVVLTVAHDHLSRQGPNNVLYHTFAAQLPGGPQHVTAGEPMRAVLPIAGASYYSLAQADIAGFALGVHSAPRGPTPLAEVELRVVHPGLLHLARARYRFTGNCRGARLVVEEDKMLTAGGFYDRVADYAELMQFVAAQRSAPAAIDYSVSYDYGSEINAFAKCFAVSANEDMPENVTSVAPLAKELFDTYIESYDECFVAGHYQQKNTIMSRQLAFVILGVATMYRATGAADYLGKLRELTNVLLDFEVRFADVDGEPISAFTYGRHSQRAAWVDGHSSSLLALVQAKRFIDDPRLAAAIDRGIGGYCLETCAMPPRKIDTVSVAVMLDGGAKGPVRHLENSYWNFNVGLALRFFNALRAADDPELQAIAAKYRGRLELFEIVMHHQLERSLTEHSDAIEIRTSAGSSETNSETQPWVMLGLLGHPYD